MNSCTKHKANTTNNKHKLAHNYELKYDSSTNTIITMTTYD